MQTCQVEGCSLPVTKPDHDLCLDHWKASRKGFVKRCATCKRWHANESANCFACEAAGTTGEDAPAGYVSSTKIGKHFGISNIKINLILAELGWIEKYGNGWIPTERGNALGANVKTPKRVPFTVWPATIVSNAALLESIGEQSGTAKPRKTKPDEEDFRSKFPANYYTTDGHRVRSRAEVMIDNWLYMQGIVHAYERRLPIEEDCYCDFYIPGTKGGVYIEFWGREKDAKYRERKAVKQALYAKHGLRLIELTDVDIERLDDVLPRELLRFGLGSW